MGIKLIILCCCCTVAFIRPIWGVAILLILTSSLFHLYQYATINLPIGYVGATEAILFTLLLHIFWNRRQYRLLPSLNSKSSPRERFAKKVLISAILPYVIWQTICCIRGILIWYGTEHFRFVMRFMVSGIFTWSFVAIIWTLRHQAKSILKIAFVVAFVTALIHIGIQFFNYRSIMMSAYWLPKEGEYSFMNQYYEMWIETSDFVRGFPRGMFLMLCCLIFSFSCFMVIQRRSKYSFYMMLMFTTLVVAIAITFTRSLLAQIFVGCFAVLFFAFILKLLPQRIIITRAAVGGVAMLLILGGYMVAKPGFADYWKQRIQAFNSEDSKIFSRKNEDRGFDNIASIKAIADHPIFGCGTLRYPNKYSLSHDIAADIHPTLEIGLIGGIPAIVLIIRLQWILFWYFWKTVRRESVCRQRQLLGYFAILATIGLVTNLCGAGGTLREYRLVTLTLFIGLMAAEYANPVGIGQSRDESCSIR